MLKENPANPRIDQVLIRMCGRLQHELVNNGLFAAETSGSTLSGVVLDFRKGKMYSFNVGDSRSVLVQNYEDEKYFQPLSVDHKFDLPEEYKRISQKGGRIS